MSDKDDGKSVSLIGAQFVWVGGVSAGAGGSHDPSGKPYGGGAGGSASRRMIDGRWYVSTDGGRTYTRED